MQEVLIWAGLGIGAVWTAAGVKGRKWLNEVTGKALGVSMWWALKGVWLALVWLVRLPFRRRRTAGLKPTREERRLMQRLAPAHWREHRERRGLDDTITGKPRLTDSGIAVSVRLDGRWTWQKLRDAEGSVRALLGARTALRIEITAGKAGTHAQMVLRTRSAADGDDLMWSPTSTSFGVDTVTGRHVVIGLGRRILIAGTSGAGKSTAARPLLYDASEGDCNRLLIIDLKMVEGRLWDHRARVAFTPEEVLQLVHEVVNEMNYRLAAMPKGVTDWTPTPDHPRLTLVVDEGAEVIGKVKKALEHLETTARMGRAPAIDLVWMTQSPTYGDGIDRQTDKQLHVRISVAVGSPTESRVVFGERAQDQGWHADQLPVPGYALVKEDSRSKPHQIRVRWMKEHQVIGLPARPIWHGRQDGSSKPRVDMEKDTLEVPPADHAEAVVMALSATEEPLDSSTLIKCCGLSRSQGYALLKRLAEEGRIKKQRHGYYSLGTEAA